MKSAAFQPASLTKKKNVANKEKNKTNISKHFRNRLQIDYKNLKSDPI